MAPQRPPTPSPSPPLPPLTSTSLSATLPGRINAATRQQHTELNRLIIHRLPLALPPYARTPFLFSKGIVPFARIFMLFEYEWDRMIRHFHRNPGAYSGHDYDVRLWLANLRPVGLARSQRLRSDLHHLCQVGGPGIYATPKLGDKWMTGIRKLVRSKPHVLAALAWVFYMAVFSGGRWIRQQLANSGAEFWTQQYGLDKRQQHPLVSEVPGVSFLSFDGEKDGDDMKTLFKSRLADAEWLLHEQEKQDVIECSEQLFELSLRLVNDLERMVYRRKMLGWSSTILCVALLMAALIYAVPGWCRYLQLLA